MKAGKRMRLVPVVSGAMTNVFSFETFFALFMFAGSFKSDARFSVGPINLTFLFLMVTIAWFIILMAKRRIRITWTSAALLMSWVAIITFSLSGLTWTPSVSYGKTKLALMATLGTWSLCVGTFCIGPDRKRVVRFLSAALVLSIWMSFETAIAFFFSGLRGNLNILGTNYLSIGRVIGIGATAALWLLVYHARSSPVKAVLFVIFCFQMMALSVLGGRGPLLSAAFTVLLTWYLTIEMRSDFRLKRVVRTRVFFFLVIGVFLFVVFLPQAQGILRTVSRLSAIIGAGENSSVGMRKSLYLTALRLWLAHPLLGCGIGSFPVLAGLGDIRAYPHNIILELLIELGLVGLVLFGLLACIPMYALLQRRRLRRESVVVVVWLLFVYMMLNAMVSGDLTDNRFLFFVIGLAAGVAFNRLKPSPTHAQPRGV
jgi:O-antigen ligase